MTDAPALPATAPRARRPKARRHGLPLMRAWHAVIAGGFLVAYLTGDSESLYRLHQVAGYAVLAAVAVRLLNGLGADRAPWRLPRVSVSSARQWLVTRRGRNPLFAWIAVALLAVVGGAAATGALADFVHAAEDVHEALAETSLWVVLGHVAFILLMFGGKRWIAALWHRLDAPRRTAPR